jgi:arylsulfatase A-like enzyme
MAVFTSLMPSHNHITALSSVLPAEVPTLAEILQSHGYHTAGLVNDGQMRDVWGFHRGFQFWKEYVAETPAGDCVHVTDRALEWLRATPAEPFFLFLHYYDPHDPYDPPAEFRKRFEAPLSRDDNSNFVSRIHFPANPLADRAKLNLVMNAYDGEIAWLDSQLERLFAHVPPNTLVVVFSDHGEGFKEHGWTLHGASLYEEETHVALVMNFPEVVPAGRVVDEPVMLIDVAPTILNACGVPAPDHYEGTDLSPTWTEKAGKRLPQRFVLSETFAPWEGNGLKMVALNEWKLIRSVFDGHEELYRLPDEKTDLAAKNTKRSDVHDVLSQRARQWLAEEDFWMIYAHGPEEMSAAIVPAAPGTQLLTAIPFGEWRGNATYEVDRNGRFFTWSCTPGQQTVGAFIQVAPADAPLRFDLRFGGRARPEQVFLGTKRSHPAGIPFDVALTGDNASLPVVDRPFVADKPGFYAFRHRGTGSSPFQATARTLDAETIRRLRNLGYLR